MPWGYAATAVGSYLGSKGKSGGGGGSSQQAYVPKDQAGVDQGFLDARKKYDDMLAGLYGTTQPYNDQLLKQAFAQNPYAQQALEGAASAAGGYQNLAGRSAEKAGQMYGYTNQQMEGADFRNRLAVAGNEWTGAYIKGLQEKANQSNATYDELMGYSRGQQGDINQSMQNLYGGGNQILQAAQDPQKELYNRTLGQITEQNRASQYARGIQSTPYGAALENQANQNFNIDWQNQQLARQAQGLQAAQGAYGNAQNMGNAYTQNLSGLQSGANQNYANLVSQAQQQQLAALASLNNTALANTQNIGMAANLANQYDTQGAQAQYAAGMAQGLPYNVSQQIASNQNQALQNYYGNVNPYMAGMQNQQQNALAYLGYGTGAQSQAFSQNAYNQAQRGQAIGQIAGSLGGAFSKGSDQLFNNSSFGDWAFNAMGGMGGSM